MVRMFGQNVPREMLVLWIIEFTLCSLILGVILKSLAPDVPLLVVNSSASLSLTISFSAMAIGLYKHDLCAKTQRMVVSLVVTGVFAIPGLMIVGAALGIDGLITRHQMLLALPLLVVWLAVLLATRTAFAMALRHNLFVRRLVVIGADAARAQAIVSALPSGLFALASALPGDRPSAVTPAGEHSSPGAWPPLETLRRQRVWGVVIAEGAPSALEHDEALLRCRFEGIRLIREVDLREQQTRRVDLELLRPDWLLRTDDRSCGRCARIARRAFDIASAGLLLLLTLPLLCATAIAVKLTSKGPIFYRQERVGLFGKSFMLLKFRSMRVDAESNGPIWASQRDSRVTAIGHFIRAIRLDELPQLLNILRGDMRLVGPRPERPHFVRELAEQVPFYNDRSYVKPGLTGWAQINYPYGASIEDGRVKLSYDLYYLKHQSLVMDLMILISTVRVVFFREGAR